MTGPIAAPVLRRLLQDAPWAQDRLKPFAGHRVAWDVAGIKGAFLLDQEGLPEQSDHTQTDTVTAPLPGVHLSLSADRVSALGKGMDALMREVRIEGNAGLAAELAFIARHLRPEPAEWMAPYIGDGPAEQVGQGLEHLMRWSAQAALRLAQSGADFAVHEARLLPPSDVLARHFNDIDVIRDATDRLEQRIARLESRLKSKATST